MRPFLITATAFLAVAQTRTAPPKPVDITVHEGTSMAAAISPDGRTIATDMQGAIWLIPAAGGAARRVTDLFNDARQPAFSPDGKWIAFSGYREGNYSIWAVAPDGTNLHQLTWGPYDDREVAWSHDGARIAFSSDRSGSYNIWTLDLAAGALTRLTHNDAENRMPSWSPDDSEIAYTSTRDASRTIWAAKIAGGAERKVYTAASAIDAPSWGPGGKIVYFHTALEVDGKALTGSEVASAFRVSWASPTDFIYTSDGKIRRRDINGGEAQTIEFTATLPVTPSRYTRRKRDFDSIAPRQALGIVTPALSPDGKRIAFTALGDLWVMTIGGKPENLTKDKYFDINPAWSPDGRSLAWSSDRGGHLMQLWIRDLTTNQDRQLTNLPTQPLGAAWSPDGKRIAFLNVDEMWGAAGVSVVDVATGQVTRVHDEVFAPGSPTWSADGSRIAVAMLSPNSKSFREGTNQVLTMAADGSNADKLYSPEPLLSIDSRAACGPVWSPDGTKMAAIYEGVLAVWPVSRAGEPIGPPRRVTTEMAHAPSWAADSTHILYQSMDKLKITDIDTGETRSVPVDLKYTPAVPKGRIVVHAGQLVDGRSQTARPNMDIVIEGNRIRGVTAHSAALHANAKVVDASGLTAMPGLIEYHTHLQPDFGESEHRAYLAFGVTTVRSAGTAPYEDAEDREANESGVRIGPRIFAAGHMMDGSRTYYKIGTTISTPAHLELELERARVLGEDLLKSYVRLDDLEQKRIVEFGHSIGIPVATHELYPAAFVGLDSIEHTGATSRRGYSPKIGAGQHSYEDVIQILGKSERILCPMIINPGVQKLLATEPALKDDPRFALYPAWVKAQLGAPPGGGRGGRGGGGRGAGGRGRGGPATGGSGQMVMDAMHAGAKIVAGTDTPNAFNLHGEMTSYTIAGMTPFEALRAATVNSAEALNLDAGSIEPGRLADIVIVEGNPLDDIANAHKVKRVIANGRVYEMTDLLAAGR